jgi:5-methylthioadenosine/S-adenosylhomocysteine deaminase
VTGYIAANDHEYKLIRAKFLLPMSRNAIERIADGYVLTKGNKILQVGSYSEEIGRAIIKEFGHDLQVLGCKKGYSLAEEDVPCINGVIMPGFVKAHGHDHEAAIIGIAKDRPLTAWLDEAVNVFGAFLNEKSKELEAVLTKSPYLVSYLKARIDDVSYGITSALTHHCNYNKYHVEELVEANTLAGTNITIAVGSQDRHYDQRILDIPASMAIERLDQYHAAFSGTARVRIIPGPDQEFSNSPDLLRASKMWAQRHESLIHIHTSEEPGTTQWFTQTYGTTPIEYLDSIGFLDERTILAHVVNVTQKELEIIKERGCKVVHNPLANTILGSGMPPIPKMLEIGIPVAISTDGSGSSDNQNILNAARVAAQYQKAFWKDAEKLPAREVLEMITIKPAEILGLNAGCLEKGRNADVVVVDLSRPNLIPTRLDNVLENLVWAANGSEIRYVIANGRILVEDYKIRVPSSPVILASLQQLSEIFVSHKSQTKVVRETGVAR